MTSNNVIQAKYDTLDTVAAGFSDQAGQAEDLYSRIKSSMQVLEDGGWVGHGAAAFFTEMNSDLFPALQRLTNVLQEARSVTLNIKRIIQSAEQEAALVFTKTAFANQNANIASIFGGLTPISDDLGLIFSEQKRIEHARRIELLREYLRQPQHWTTPAMSQGDHQKALAGIWQRGLALANGDRYEALKICEEAVKSSQQPGETAQEYHNRLGGVPSKVFGTQSPLEGPDKPQHFFRVAQISYCSSEIEAKAAGRAWEIKDWIVAKATGKNTGGYDTGDIVADDCGAEFGSALSTSPNANIRNYLPPVSR